MSFVLVAKGTGMFYAGGALSSTPSIAKKYKTRKSAQGSATRGFKNWPLHQFVVSWYPDEDL